MTEYKKSELTAFAKQCSIASNQLSNGICFASELVKENIGRQILRGNNEEILLEVSKRFAKYAKEQDAFDVETGEVQDFQKLIVKIIECCDENDWFGLN